MNQWQPCCTGRMRLSHCNTTRNVMSMRQDLRPHRSQKQYSGLIPAVGRGNLAPVHSRAVILFHFYSGGLLRLLHVVICCWLLRFLLSAFEVH